MPCWYYEKKELKNTPSFLDGIDPNTEARYRREGARFIFDAGTKMGLRYDSCATGVVYFHRFYMFHSFKEFHRYVTGACCLFLAGKVEETPKKCKDIIKTCRGLLTEQQFAVFGEDPREEVMTLERILLQTIKFDLQVEHPYSRLLHYAKLVKGDKQKIQKVVQMAWTFVNDSMCTMLSLQWEPDIISVAMLYLATRLSKLDIQDWVGKPPGSKLKWWEGLVEDLSQELIEDICHQVLDLYSKQSQKREESPPITSEKSLHPPGKRNRNSPPQDDRGGPAMDTSIVENPGGKAQKMDGSRAPSRSSSVEDSSRRSSKGPTDHTPSVQGVSSGYPGPPPSSVSRTTPGSSHPGPHQAYSGGDTSGYSQYNPYVSSQMFSSSFMSQEGSQSIQSLITGGDSGGQSHGGEYQQQYQQPPPSAYHPPGYSNNHPQPGPPYQVYSGYPPSTSSSSQPTAQQYQGGAQSYQNPPPQYNYGSDYSQPGGYPSSYHPTSGQPFPPRFGAPGGPPRGPPPKNAKKKKDAPNKSTCLATVRITGR